MTKKLFIILISINALFAQAQMERVMVKGNSFVNKNGDTLVFRGVSSSDPDKLKIDGLWNEKYFKELKAWGANLVRFPIHPQRLRNRGINKYLKLLDQGIKWAEDMNIYVVIDWHSIGNLETGLFLHEKYATDKIETLNFWRLIAERYGKNTTVAFYEIFNEPTMNGGKFGTLQWEDWKTFNEEAIKIIRANEGEGIPLVAGFNWAYDLTPLKEHPLDIEGIGYVSHPYPQKREKPWEAKWTEDWGFVKSKYPLILTEMGFCTADDPGAHVPVISDKSYGIAISDYCEKRGISYLVWVFDKDWGPNMYTDRKFTPSLQGAFFKKQFQKFND